MQIFYVQSCGIYPYDSSNIIWIGTSQRKLKMFVSKEIENGNMHYYDDELPAKKQAELFRHDWEDCLRRDINNHLMYGYISYVENNEEV